MPQRQRIKIIGGGFCGTMVLWHLMQADDAPPLDITLYDEHGRHGRGVAYSTPYEEHLLNVPAGGMSALPHNRDHFLRWLGEGADQAKFYPRKLYGDYLTSFLAEARSLAQEKGHIVTLSAERAEPEDDSICILATGTSQPLWPGSIRPDVPEIIDNPYQLYETPPGSETALILGTGLSAVDAIMTLHRKNFTGKIICVSRHGLWPVPHGPKTKFWHWRKYIDLLRPYSNRIWQALPRAVRAFCLKNITYWNIIRHRMPPECYSVMRKMRNSGQLLTVRGNILGIEVSPSGIGVKTNDTTLHGSTIINCLGFISYNQKPVTGFWIGEKQWVMGAPLFGHFIETTAVPELRHQAEDVANNVLQYIQNYSKTSNAEL